MESDDTIVTWCVGHLVTMCYPDAYDPRYKKWSLTTIPFLPDTYKYEVISSVKKQFGIVKKILTDKDGVVHEAADCFDVTIINDQLDRAVDETQKVINNYLLR